MSTLTNLASDVVEFILNLFKTNKDDSELVKSDEILTDEETLAYIPEPQDPVESSDNPDSNANSELVELASEEPSAANTTEPDATLVAFAPNTPAHSTPPDLAANDPIDNDNDQRNRDSEDLEDSANDKQIDRTKSRAEASSNKEHEGLDEFEEQAWKNPTDTARPDRSEPSEQELEMTEASLTEITKPDHSEQTVDSDTLEMAETDLTEQIKPEPKTLEEPDIAPPDLDATDLAATDLTTTPEIMAEPALEDNSFDATQSSTTDLGLPTREIVTADSFHNTADTPCEFPETLHNPSYVIDPKHTGFETTLAGKELSALNDRIGVTMDVPFDEPVVTGQLSNNFQNTVASNDASIVATQPITPQLAAGGEKFNIADQGPPPDAPGLG